MIQKRAIVNCSIVTKLFLQRYFQIFAVDDWIFFHMCAKKVTRNFGFMIVSKTIATWDFFIINKEDIYLDYSHSSSQFMDYVLEKKWKNHLITSTKYCLRYLGRCDWQLMRLQMPLAPQVEICLPRIFRILFLCFSKIFN